MYRRISLSNRHKNDHNFNHTYFYTNDEILKCIAKMFTLSPGDALDYAAVFEDAAEELHILGKLVPPHYQYTESADEVNCNYYFSFFTQKLRLLSLDCSYTSSTCIKYST